MEKPFIGIVSKPIEVTDMWHYMSIVDDIRCVLVKNGALVCSLLPSKSGIDFKLDEEIDSYNLSTEEIEDLEEVIKKLDGVVLEGGLVSNKYEEEVARICIRNDVPILGICSGFNNLVRALGGRVHIDSNIFHNQFGAKVAHEVLIDKDSKLYSILKTDRILVNSIHTCIVIDDELKEYKVVARCPVDNTIEAFELPNKRFVMGIKWHPELMESMNDIFKEFVGECKKKGI